MVPWSVASCAQASGTAVGALQPAPAPPWPETFANPPRPAGSPSAPRGGCPPHPPESAGAAREGWAPARLGAPMPAAPGPGASALPVTNRLGSLSLSLSVLGAPSHPCPMLPFALPERRVPTGEAQARRAPCWPWTHFSGRLWASVSWGACWMAGGRQLLSSCPLVQAPPCSPRGPGPAREVLVGRRAPGVGALPPPPCAPHDRPPSPGSALLSKILGGIYGKLMEFTDVL